MKNYSGITYRYLKVQKKRTILTILGIMLSAALITSIGTMVVSMRDMLLNNAIANYGDYHVAFLNVPGNKVDKIENNVGVEKSGVSYVQGYGVVGKLSAKETESNPGAPPYRYLEVKASNSSMSGIFKTQLKEGRLPEKPGEIVLDYWVTGYMADKPKVGDKITLDMGIRKDKDGKVLSGTDSWSEGETFEKTGEAEYTIVGLMDPRSTWVGGYFADGITYLDGKNLSDKETYDVYVKMASTDNITSQAEGIAKNAGLPMVKTGDKLTYSIAFNEDVLRISAGSTDVVLNDSMKEILAFIIILIIISTIAVIYNSFNISVLERVSQFGVLRCTGASPNQIRSIVLKEAFILSAIGIPLGLILGVFAMDVVLQIIGALKYNLLKGLTLSISPEVFILSALLGLVTVFLSAYGPAMLAAKVSPLDAVRNTGKYKKEDFSKVKRSRLAKALLNIEGQIAFKNLRRNRKRFRVTVFSMVISIVLYIVFGSFSGYLFKVNAGGNMYTGDFGIWRSGSSSAIEESVFNDVKKLPGVSMVYKSMNTYVDVIVPENKANPKLGEIRKGALDSKTDGSVILHNSQVMSYGDDSFSDLDKLLKSGTADINELNNENGVILLTSNKITDQSNGKEVMLDAADYKVGDTIEFSAGNPKGDPKEMKIQSAKVLGILDKGILGDQYNQDGGINIITTEEMYKKLTGIQDYYFMTIKLDSNADREPVLDYLKALNDKDPSYQYTDSTESARQSRDMAVTLSIFLYGFVAVIALIGCINIINTISTNLILRKRELSMMRAAGMTGGGVKKMVCLEGIYYGIIAAVYGSIIGTFLSYLLYRLIIGVREFEWSIPSSQIITGALGAIAVTIISSLIPLRKINKGNIIDNIRAEE